MLKYIILSIFILTGFNTGAQTPESYFREAAENNPGLQARYKDFEAALQEVPQVSSLPDPSLSMGVFLSPVETRVGPQQFKLSLSQMFPWFGTLEAKGNAAALMAEAKYQAFLDARNQLYYKVAAAYYPLVELNQWIAIEEENIDILDSYKNIATRNFENGKGSMVDVLRVDLMLKDAATNLEILRVKAEPLISEFNQLLNREKGEKVVLPDSVRIEEVPENFRRDSLLTSNPVLQSLQLKKEASEEAEKAAVKQGLPRLGLGLDYVAVGERSGADIPDNGKDVLMPMVTVSIPIFRKKYRAAVEESRLNQESYQLQYKDYANSLVAGYDQVLFELDQQAMLTDLYDEKIEEAQQALNLLFTAYGNSGNDFEEVLRMQQELLKYEKMKVTAIKKYQVALAKLNYLTAKSY